MKAMILAAGEGTRLRPLTATLPKPLIPIVGTPLLARTLAWLAEQGVTEAAINLYHRPQAIPDTLGDEYAGVRLHYFFEDVLRGTAGGVKAAESLFRGAPFYVIYGDNLIHADLRRLRDFHESHGGAATVALFHHPNPSAAGIVAADADGRITRFVEKPPPDQVFSDLANAGVYVLDPSVLDAIPDRIPVDFAHHVFPTLLGRGARLYGTPLGGYLQDTGTPQQYRQANWDVLAGRVGTEFVATSRWLGPGAHVDPAARLERCNVIGPGARVGAGAVLTDCILWEGAEVGPGVRLERAILARHAAVYSKDSLPAELVVGENEKVG